MPCPVHTLIDLLTDNSPRFLQVNIFEDCDMQTNKELYDAAECNVDYVVIVSLRGQIKIIT